MLILNSYSIKFETKDNKEKQQLLENLFKYEVCKNVLLSLIFYFYVKYLLV